MWHLSRTKLKKVEMINTWSVLTGIVVSIIIIIMAVAV